MDDYGLRSGSMEIHDGMVERILAQYHAASAECLADGRRWYAVAHAHALRLSAEYDVSLNTVALLIASLSPQKSWTDNLIMAEQALRGEDIPLATGINKRKAHAVLCGDVVELTALKTRNFWELIRDSGNDFSVCVDTHAIVIALGYRPYPTVIKAIFSNTAGMYGNIQQAYISAARPARIKPYVMQATTWCARRASLPQPHGQSVVEV